MKTYAEIHEIISRKIDTNKFKQGNMPIPYILQDIIDADIKEINMSDISLYITCVLMLHPYDMMATITIGGE